MNQSTAADASIKIIAFISCLFKKLFIFFRGNADHPFKGFGEIIWIVKPGFLRYLVDSEVLSGLQKALGLFYADFTEVIRKGGIHLFAEQMAQMKGADKDGVRYLFQGQFPRVVDHYIIDGPGKIHT